MALLVRQPVSYHRNKRLVLPHALTEGSGGVAQPNPEGLPFRVEGVEVNHPLEAAERELRELSRADGDATEGVPKVGAVLFQLPPQFSKNRERLASFLGMLPRCYPYAFEFRHTSWYEDDIYEILRAHDVSLCLSDHHDAPSPWEVTARHVYLRGHGPDGRYKDHYPDKTLRTWARHIGNWRSQRRTVFVYFDNDQKSAAPTDARRLCELLQQAGR
jgi:uncharacterized protein YecE (DUF72 family)